MHPGRMKIEPDINYSIGYVVVNPWERNLPHRLSNPETYYVLEGEGTIYIAEVPISLHKGKLVVVPANETQYVENTGNSSLLFLVINQPAWEAEYEKIEG